MPENPNLQNEIDSILTHTDSGPISHPPQTQANQQNQATQSTHVQNQYSQPQTYSQEVVTSPTIQTTPVANQYQSNVDAASSNIITESTRSANSPNYLLFIGIGFIVLLIALVFIMRKSIFGPLSFTDCAELETSRIIELEPAYCVTQEGEIFYKNRNEALPEESEFVDSFDPNNPPETALPVNQ